MTTRLHQLSATALAALLVFGGFAPAQTITVTRTPRPAPTINVTAPTFLVPSSLGATWRPFLPTPPVVPVNPNFQVAPGLSLNQAAFNTAVIGRAVSNIPPYALGYNPYGTSSIGTGIGTGSVGGYPLPLYGSGYGSGYGSTLSTTGGYGGAAGYPSSATLSTNPSGGYDSGTAARAMAATGITPTARTRWPASCAARRT